MKAKLAPIYFDPGRDQEFDLQCRHPERHLADDAELLEPTALGSSIPDADAVIFPRCEKDQVHDCLIAASNIFTSHKINYPPLIS